jgi:hypothetical protein
MASVLEPKPAEKPERFAIAFSNVLIGGAVLGLCSVVWTVRIPVLEAALGQAADVLRLVAILTLFALGLIYARYLDLLGLGAAEPGSAERLAYHRLRATLAKGGTPAALYRAWLTAGLDRVDRFFGDRTEDGWIAPTLRPLFDGIAAAPQQAQYFWVYALLLSTMVPSLANLAIGGAALTRGIPGLPSLLLAQMPEDEPVLALNRSLVALALTLQWLFGAVFALAAQGALVCAVFGRLLPGFGLDLLDLARAVADFDLPGRLF